MENIEHAGIFHNGREIAQNNQIKEWFDAILWSMEWKKNKIQEIGETEYNQIFKSAELRVYN